MNIQLDFFSSETSLELARTNESLDKMRRRLFARMNDLEAQVLSLQERLDKMEKEKK
jgi:hypothetical protein